MKRLTVKEAAAYIGASEYKTYEMIRQKALPHYKIGSKILLRPETLDSWIQQQEVQSNLNREKC